MPVVQKAEHAASGGGHQQVQETISVNVCENRSPAKPIRTDDTRLLGDILEFHAAEIPVEGVAAVEAAEVKVGQPVIVVVSDRHAGAIEQNAIALAGIGIQGVGKRAAR